MQNFKSHHLLKSLYVPVLLSLPDARTELPPTCMVVSRSPLFRGRVGGGREGKWAIPPLLLRANPSQFQSCDLR